jgi:hypothetical protein
MQWGGESLLYYGEVFSPDTVEQAMQAVTLDQIHRLTDEVLIHTPPATALITS